MRFRLLALCLVAHTSVPHAAVVVPPYATPFERGVDDLVLAVRLNGRGPFRMLLDTGSTHTSVSARTATAIQAPVVAKVAMSSAAGRRDALVVRVDVLEVGPIAAQDLLASVVEFDAVAQPGAFDGVIGHDVLGPLRYTLDFRGRQVVWWPVQARLAPGSALELQPSHGRFLVSLPQRRSVLRLVPDSGAESLVLFDPEDALPVTRLPHFATLTTPSGSAQVRLATVRELHVGTLTLRDIPAAVAQRDRSEPAEIDGLLPLHVFDRVTIDGPRKRLSVEGPL